MKLNITKRNKICVDQLVLLFYQQKEVKCLQEQLMGVQKQLAELHSQVKCLTEICSPQNVTVGRAATDRRSLGPSPMNEDYVYENVSAFVPDQHNLTYTIQRTVSDLLMCSTSPQPPASPDRSNLDSFDSFREDSQQSISISDISHIPAIANTYDHGQLNYSVSDILEALHPSPELCPPHNTPVSVCNSTYTEIADNRIPPCARRLFLESFTESGQDLFTGRFQEAHSSPEAQSKVVKVKRSHTIATSSKNKQRTECEKPKTNTKEFIFRRCSTRRSLKIPKKAKRDSSHGCHDRADFLTTKEHAETDRLDRRERAPYLGKELSTQGLKRKHVDSTYQSLNHFDMEESISLPIYQSINRPSHTDTTASSDSTAFNDEPLCPQAVTKKTKSSKRKSISKELRRFGKNIQRFGAKKLKLETLAVL